MDLLSAYTAMLRIRLFEERVLDCARRGLVPGSVHPCTGQEAIAVGALAARNPAEWVVSFYRNHGHALAAGSPPEPLFREILGRAGGVCGGRGGSMHLADRDHRLLGSTSIVAAQLPIAAGVAMAEKLAGDGHAAIVFCGDGALSAGGAYEALSVAAAQELPLLIVCEDNGWQDRTDSRLVGLLRPADLVRGLGLSCVEVDGNDVTAVYEATRSALARCRAGDGPRVLVARTYLRDFHAQLGPTPPAEYRPAPERERWRRHDPIDLAAARLGTDAAAIEALAAGYARESSTMDGALARALAADEPDPATADCAAITVAGWV